MASFEGPMILRVGFFLEGASRNNNPDPTTKVTTIDIRPIRSGLICLLVAEIGPLQGGPQTANLIQFIDGVKFHPRQTHL